MSMYTESNVISLLKHLAVRRRTQLAGGPTLTYSLWIVSVDQWMYMLTGKYLHELPVLQDSDPSLDDLYEGHYQPLETAEEMIQLHRIPRIN